ncbi:MAG TPA: two-component regulator propeller domain-containing protein, partial [Opitutaceae bacterium]|nr:two-component regulator propeller domain-containing protein [Opitutaceae bacterium]
MISARQQAFGLVSVASTVCCLLTVTAMAIVSRPALVAATAAAPAAYTVREWHTDDGLPSEIVTEICQDRHGYLWIATSAGLARFDGSHFKLVTPDAAVYPTRAPFLAMAAMPDDALFLVPREGDPLILRQGKFVAQPLPAPFAGQPVIAAQVETDGTHWFALRD